MQTLMDKTKRPASAVAAFITDRIDSISKTQSEIAEELGFEAPNMISMIKQGKSKVPMSKIPALARSLGIDPLMFAQMCIEEYFPDIQELMVEVFKQPRTTRGEVENLKILRAFGMGEEVLTVNELRVIRSLRKTGALPAKRIMNQEEADVVSNIYAAIVQQQLH